MQVEKMDFHPNRLRFMFAVNIVAAGAIGLAFLIMPSTVYSFFSAKAVDSMWAAGYAYCTMVGIGVFAILGLRSPLKFSVVLLLQAAVKAIWILAIAVPSLVAGTMPSYAVALCIMFAFMIAGDLIAVPYRHLLAT